MTVVDRRNHHLFQPLLYQVATGTLSPANIASPLRVLLKRAKNTRVLLAEAREIDVEGRRVILDDGEVAYDTLVVATGSSHSYFGHDEWGEHRAGTQVDRRRHDDPPPDSLGLRGGRANVRSGGA